MPPGLTPPWLARRFQRQLRRERGTIYRTLLRDVGKAWGDAAGDVVARFIAGGATGEDLFTTQMIDRIYEDTRAAVTDGLARSFQVTDDVFDLGAPQPRWERELRAYHDRIDDSVIKTRREMERTLNRYAAGDIDQRQAERRLKALTDDDWRARRRARTEMAIITNEGAIVAMEESGVAEVVIFDGPGCGWLSHDDSDIADGSTRTLSDFRANPIAHPNCVRSGAPA